MKFLPFAFVATFGFIPTVHAATVQALFTGQTQATSGGPVTGYSTVVSASTFPVAPTLVKTGTAAPNNGNGGAADYTDFNGWTWVGAGGTTAAGRSFGWISGSTNNSLTFTLNMTGLESLSVGMVIRSAAVLGTPVAQFSSIQYSLNGVDFFAAAAGEDLNFSATGGSFEAFSLDLTSLASINDAASVLLRFTVPDIPADVPGVQNNTSVRLDNILFTAQTIPEPGIAVLGLLGTGFFVFRRR